MLHRLSLFALLFSVLVYAISLIAKFCTGSSKIAAEFIFLGACYNALAASLVNRLVWSASRKTAGLPIYATLLFFKLPLALLGLYLIAQLGQLALLNALVGLLSFIPMIFLYQFLYPEE